MITHKRKRGPLTTEERQRIDSLLAGGMTIRDVAAQIGINRHRLGRVLRGGEDVKQHRWEDKYKVVRPSLEAQPTRCRQCGHSCQPCIDDSGESVECYACQIRALEREKADDE